MIKKTVKKSKKLKFIYKKIFKIHFYFFNNVLYITISITVKYVIIIIKVKKIKVKNIKQFALNMQEYFNIFLDLLFKIFMFLLLLYLFKISMRKNSFKVCMFLLLLFIQAISSSSLFIQTVSPSLSSFIN